MVLDMELMNVLPSAEDEVNTACFHPLAGVGLVYGTKEGKLRILQHDGGHAPIPDHFYEARAVEVWGRQSKGIDSVAFCGIAISISFGITPSMCGKGGGGGTDTVAMEIGGGSG
ncbi:unnamed protein product [Lactuca saligna]|uniref:Uncharacterized protein n=1 Tax=Lactuca saligna TaxID=75948 RepID=A0AA35YYB7_LACSI|nr:unnamed protein product [Lactuca saligna]